MLPSSNKRHLRDRTFCHHCLQERHVSPNCEIMVPWYNICRVGVVAHNVVEGKTLCNVLLKFKISVIQVLLQLQKESRNFIKIFGISLADSNVTLPFKFVTAITNADDTSTIKTSTLGTLNMDLNLQNREEKCFC